MVINDVKKVDEGDYTCIAKNKAGEKAEEVSLNVFGKRITPFAYDSINTVALFLSLSLSLSLSSFPSLCLSLSLYHVSL